VWEPKLVRGEATGSEGQLNFPKPQLTFESSKKISVSCYTYQQTQEIVFNNKEGRMTCTLLVKLHY